MCPSIASFPSDDDDWHPEAIVQYFIPLSNNPAQHMRLSKMGEGPLGQKMLAGDRVYRGPGSVQPWQYEKLFGHPGKGGNVLAGDSSVNWHATVDFPIWSWFPGEGVILPVKHYYVFYNFTGTSYRWFQPNAAYRTSSQPPDLFF